MVSADPQVLMNTVHQNIENGIVTIAKNFIRCDSQLKFNYVEKNKECGILCAGTNNFTRMEKNTISTNRKAGIKIFESATVSIMKNRIFGNFSQGVLLVEGTSAHIELNEIFTNFKANIAFGGAGSSDTVIVNNDIYSSRAEGIFIIESGYCWIRNNRIRDNNDGITMFDSSPHICDNYIHEN